MEVPGSIPGTPKSLFGVMLGWCFLWFLHMLGHVGGHFGDTFWSGRGHYFVNFGDVLGSVWELFGDVFGWVWEGFGKKVRRGPEIKQIKIGREYFP